MSNNISIRNIDPQQITIYGAGQPTGITNVYVNGVDVTVGTKAYVLVPTNNNELLNGAGYITAEEETDPTVPAYVKAISLADINAWNDKQDQLVSGSTIKTINNESLLGSGNIEIVSNYVAGDGIDITDNVISNTITSYNDLSDTPTIPTRTSDLVNDSGFITNQTDSLVNYLTTEVLEDILPHTSDSGTGDLYLEDSVKYKIKMELNPSEIEQYTTTGVNLFGKELFDTTMWYVTGTEDEFTIQAIAAGTTEQAIPYDLNTCKFDGTIYYEDMDGAIILREGTTSRGTILAVYDHSTNTVDKDITMVNRVDNLRIVVYNNTCKITFRRCQLQSGNTATPFELYTGGMPSPNPLYPQDIHVTSGENSITISNKNLLDISDMTSGGGITINEDNSITLNGNVTSKSFTLTKPFILKANQPYTLSITNSDPSYSASAFILRNGSTNITDVTFNNLSTQYTPSVDKVVDTLRIYNGTGSFDNFTFSVQLEYGSSATSYVPHQETAYPIELVIGENNYPTDCYKITSTGTWPGVYENKLFKNVPSNPDYIDWVDLNRWIYKQPIIKINLGDYAEFDEVHDDGDHMYFVNNNVSFQWTKLYGTSYNISNYFSTISPSNGNYNCVYISDSSIIIHLDYKVGISTLEDLNEWLSTERPDVYYVQDWEHVPNFIDITGSTLASELENLYNANSYDGGTNISQENDDLPFNIEADTLRKVS